MKGILFTPYKTPQQLSKRLHSFLPTKNYAANAPLLQRPLFYAFKSHLHGLYTTVSIKQ